MTTLSPWEVVQDIGHARPMMDRLDRDPHVPGPQWQPSAARLHEVSARIALDVIERDCCFVVSAAMAGVNPGDIEIVLSDNVLTIKGKWRAEQPYGEQSYHLRERLRGSFSRRVVFSSAINASNIETVYENGVLDVVLPKSGVFEPARMAACAPGNSQIGFLQVRTQATAGKASDGEGPQQVAPNAMHS